MSRDKTQAGGVMGLTHQASPVELRMLFQDHLRALCPAWVSPFQQSGVHSREACADIPLARCSSSSAAARGARHHHLRAVSSLFLSGLRPVPWSVFPRFSL